MPFLFAYLPCCFTCSIAARAKPDLSADFRTATPPPAPVHPSAPDEDSDYETPRELLPLDAYGPVSAAPPKSGGGSLFHAQDLIGVRKGPSVTAAAAAAAAAAGQRPGSVDVTSISKRPGAPAAGSVAGSASFLRRQ